MKFAICYKGVFNIDYIRKFDIDDNILKSLYDTFINHNDTIYRDLIVTNNTFDILISSYNIDDKINNIISKLYNPRKSILSSKDEIYTNTFLAQLAHFKKIILLIKESEEEDSQEYDYLIFTRFDIEFHKNFNSLNLDLSKFNITVEHSSGNCDDNLIIFPRKLLYIFEQAVDRLIIESKMTHELNHKLILFGGEINYIDKLIQTYMGHTIFSFIR